MNYIKLTGLLLMVALALCASVASSAWAGAPELTTLPDMCLKVDVLEAYPGFYKDKRCSELAARGGPYEIAKPEHKIAGDLWCARVSPLHQETGPWEDSACQVKEPSIKGEFILVEKVPLGLSFVAGLEPLGAGATANVTTSNLGAFTLKAATFGVTVLCTGLSAPTTLLGGSPGGSDTEVKFSGCTTEERGTRYEKCDANSSGATGGNITLKAKDELVYTGSKAEAEKEQGPVGDLFSAEGGGETFVTLTFEALEPGACPSLAVETAVEGSVVGEVEPVNAFAKQGMLKFPTTAIKRAFRWEGEGRVKEVKAGLSAFGFSATESGLADLELESKEEWGVING